MSSTNNASTGKVEVKVDDLLPEEIARKAETFFARKAGVKTPNLWVLATLAGAYIGFGSIFSQVVLAGGADLPFGVRQGLCGMAFSLGLILVVVGGAELFTGNTMMVIPRAQERATAVEVLSAWAWAYGGNFVGSVLIVMLFVLAGGHTAGDGQVGLAALETAQRKAGLTAGSALASGILANMLVCLAVWLSLSARATQGKIFAIVWPITAFVACGFEHSVANMSLIPMGLMILAFADQAFWLAAGVEPTAFTDLTATGFLWNLLWSTTGNIIGGGLIGMAYWSVFRRGK
ncbi:formate transporter FocA [Phragmitibacter flavus]|uniref:Formate transporter FocA n=2 Tax=Phragmitibacter flavus TaxID=2576071 RepID=A0A5R8KH21_9BACT|nr:formate transporter FocA [Phragmitibacter flavus]